MTSQSPVPCDAVRVALSAQLDHEDPGTPTAHLAAHLETCADCRRWLARAEQVTRAVRRAEPEPVPDLTEVILAAVAADAAPRPAPVAAGRPRRWRQRLQVATVAVAAAQLVIALPELLGALGFGDGLHAGHERASLDVALAVGFLLAGMQPALARAYTPVGFVLALCLTLTSGLDVLYQRVTLGHELAHLVVVAQAVLVWALSRTVPADPPRRPAAAGL